jgi:hypothetical protein
MKVPARRPGAEEPQGGKWETIRYAIGRWDTTVRLLIILLVLSAPISLILINLIKWLGHP